MEEYSSEFGDVDAGFEDGIFDSEMSDSSSDVGTEQGSNWEPGDWPLCLLFRC